MGEVYRARDPRLGRDVAIKVLPAQFAENPDRVRRLEQEARAIAALNHPHICQIHDVGPGYLVLEYIEGTPLTGPLSSSRGRTTWRCKLPRRLTRRAPDKGSCTATSNPANILVRPRRHAPRCSTSGWRSSWPSDARRHADAPRHRGGHRRLHVAGTARGQRRSTRAPTSSASASSSTRFCQARAPSAGTPLLQVLRAVLRDDPPPLRTLPALERIVQRCLAKDASRRYQTMGEVTAALAQTQRESRL